MTLHTYPEDLTEENRHEREKAAKQGTADGADQHEVPVRNVQLEELQEGDRRE